MPAETSYTLHDVAWTDQAALLGISVEGRALPAVTQCPLCHEDSLSVHKGLTTSSPHCFCGDCQFSGTLLELAAKLWDISLGEAAAKMTDMGAAVLDHQYTDEDVAGADRHLDRLKRFRKLFTDSRDNLHRGAAGTAESLLRRFHLSNGSGSNRWREGPGATFGANTCSAVELAFAPGLAHPEERNPSRSRTFVGPKWKDVLVLPRYNARGSLCGFEFVGRKGDAEDRVFRSIEQTHGRVAELGLFGLDAPFAEAPFGSAVLAVDDAVLALRLQVRHAASASKPLPIVAWADTTAARTRDAWGSLAGRHVVFWSQRMTAKLLRQAMLTDGHVSLAGPNDPDDAESWSTYLRAPGSAYNLLRKVERTSRPWYVCLSKWIESQPENRVEVLLRSLLQNSVDLEAIIRAVNQRARKIIAVLNPDRLREATRSVEMGKYLVVETGCGWYAYSSTAGSSNRRHISSCVIRLTEIRRYPNSNSTYCVGHVVVGHDRLPFQLPTNRRYRLPAVVRETLAAHGRDEWVTAPHGLELFQIALAFHQPTVEQD